MLQVAVSCPGHISDSESKSELGTFGGQLLIRREHKGWVRKDMIHFIKFEQLGA